MRAAADRPPTVRVTDHALLRYVERVMGVDLEPIRAEIARGCDDAARAGASCYTLAGVQFRFARDQAGRPVVSTVTLAEDGKGRRP